MIGYLQALIRSNPLTKTCELVWDSDRGCKEPATHRIEVTIHSGIFSGLYELNNSKKFFAVCDRHFGLVKDDKDVKVL